jgi:hypothetical protein
MRISAEQRQQNEARIRAAIDRLLAGDILPGGKCDVKTLALEADVDRAAFYGTRPYAHLREEFETRLKAREQVGDIPDRREAQIARLKDDNAALRQRLADRGTTITTLTDFRKQALAQLAARHDEITRLSNQNKRAATVRLLPTPATCKRGRYAQDPPLRLLTGTARLRDPVPRPSPSRSGGHLRGMLAGAGWKVIADKSGVTRPGFAVMLRSREIEGRFPAWSAAPVRPCAAGTCRPGNLQVLSL